jgi:metal-responsive CopG/Arc/MetJ family transcriptional regulator
MTTISLKLPAELDRRLRQVAKEQHMSRSAVIRVAAEHYIEESDRLPGSCLELAADLVGCAEGPEDLSSNKAHLQGFGQ